MESIIEKIIDQLERNAAKIYLVTANMVLVLFAIWFSKVGLLPLAGTDFVFFIILCFVLGIYRPSWMFAFFVGTLALENINLAPSQIGLTLRPYQLFGFITIVSVIIGFFTKRLHFKLPKFKWYDTMPLIFLLGGILSSLASSNHGAAFKQAIIAATFASLYYLARIYIQSLEDAKRILPFFLSSGLVVCLYGIWQNLRFLNGQNSYEVMLGRPNATFTEPDWLGIYLAFLISVIYTVIYYFVRENKKSSVISHQSSENKNSEWTTDDRLQMTSVNLKIIMLYIALMIIFISLILTVSRSAWLGAVLVTIGFLKIILTNGSIKISNWKWNEFLKHFTSILVVGVISILIATQLTNFQIFKRAQSTGGLQNITVACKQDSALNTQSVIKNIDELESYGCRFINLEEKDNERAQGLNVFEIKRPDPTVGIRAQIYAKSIEQIKLHPIFGIGWGSISDILGKDENGTGLNASNIFLEVWLGSGLIGFLSVVILFGYLLIKSSMLYLNRNNKDKTIASFVALGWFAIVVPNLFNSGIFLGFVWIYLAVAFSLLSEKNNISK